MPDPDRRRTVRELYDTWLAADRERMQRLLGDDFRFSSPPDPDLDRARWFEVCWPAAGTNVVAFDLERLVELPGDEVLVTYVATRPDGSRFRNTEIHGVAGDGRIVRTEVYFGPDLD